MTKDIKKSAITVLLMLFSILTGTSIYGQNGILSEHEAARNTVWPAKILKKVEFLADSICQGRATGTRGNVEAGFYIVKQFEKAGLMPMEGTFVKHFFAGRGLVGHNIMGFLPASIKNPSDKYVIVGAHYDHLGSLSGSVYPGADANASGTAALICLADMFSTMKTLGKSYGKNIIFVAFDAKEMDMAGSEALWRIIENKDLINPQTGAVITPDKISLMVNIDQIGTTLAPIHKDRPDYMIMLGTHSLPRDKRTLLQLCNKLYSINLDLGLDYYSSENFTRIFYRLSDQKVFVDNGIPAVMFTSGITMNTNRTRDTPSTISGEITKRRIWLIYHWLSKMI